MKKAHIDNNNNLLGWYDTDIHTTIPTPNIDVTEEEWQDAISISANTFENGKFIKKDKRTQEDKDRDKEEEDWASYKKARELSEKQSWKDAGKPKFN